MNSIYQTPSLRKLENGLMNKFGPSPAYAQRVRTEIDGVAIDELVHRYGSPLFVFSERRIRDRHEEVRRAFSTRYDNVSIAWSYKTNYLKAICAIMHQEGSLAEVVSSMEYEKARALGVPGDRILFNGPYKTKAALERAVDEGARIHVDHEDEIEDLEAIAEALDRPVRVSIRLNLDAGIHPQWSRFGFNLESGEAMRAVRRLGYRGRLILDGLHCHIGTYILDPSAYERQLTKMIAFAYGVEDVFGYTIDMLDIGGGLPSTSRLKGSYLPADVTVPSVDEYAIAVSRALESNLRPGHRPELVIESGRSMVDEAGFLITTVTACKHLPDGTRAYVMDAGVNDLFTSFWYKHGVELDRPVAGFLEPTVLYGPLCMNIDVIGEGLQLPALPRGARLILSPVGAYNVTQWMQFIHYRPAVVLVNEEGEAELIREGEDLSDIERRERLPERLRLDGVPDRQ